MEVIVQQIRAKEDDRGTGETEGWYSPETNHSTEGVQGTGTSSVAHFAFKYNINQVKQ